MAKGAGPGGTWRKAITQLIGIIAVTVGCAAIVFLINVDFDPGKSQTCTSDTITATVEEDGSLHVVEERSYHFAGSWELTAEQFDPPDKGQVKVNGVSIIDASGNKRTLKSHYFDSDWRDSGGPSSECYAFDDEENTVYAFSDSENEDKTFVFDYTYTNAITRYDDCSVLYWQFIPSGWDVDTNNVTATISLPATASDPMRAGENVFAYGHAAQAGSIATDDASHSVTYSMPVVRTGSFAEARIAFPLKWTARASGATAASGAQLAAIQAEEGRWQQDDASELASNVLYLVVPVLIGGGMALAGFMLYRRYGTEYEPVFKEKYWRDVPDADLHPLMIARLWNADEENADDLVISLMYLSSLGYARIEPVNASGTGKHGPHQKVRDYRVLPTEKPLSDLSPIDRDTYELVFEKIGGGSADGVLLGKIKEYADEHPEEYLAEISSWQSEADKLESGHLLFEPEGLRYRKVLRQIFTLVYLGAAFALFDWFIDSYQWLWIGGGAAFMYAFSTVMPRRSRESVEVFARCEGLQRWFQDFTRLDEAVPSDTKVWGQLLIYAYIFGVADQVAQDLRSVYPELWTDEAFISQSYWYFNAAGTGAAAMGAGDMFGSAFGTAVNAAHEALGDDMSSGGGGGFGGGGGGFSR
ncbi:MAG: DUF2207 family protein [Eggerthellaceae bacterium]|jgi:uncharacterized membrane protein